MSPSPSTWHSPRRHTQHPWTPDRLIPDCSQDPASTRSERLQRLVQGLERNRSAEIAADTPSTITAEAILHNNHRICPYSKRFELLNPDKEHLRKPGTISDTSRIDAMSKTFAQKMREDARTSQQNDIRRCS